MALQCLNCGKPVDSADELASCRDCAQKSSAPTRFGAIRRWFSTKLCLTFADPPEEEMHEAVVFDYKDDRDADNWFV